MSKEEKEIEIVFQNFCEDVVRLDPAIRFAGIADEDGKLQAITERAGLKPY